LIARAGKIARPAPLGATSELGLGAKMVPEYAAPSGAWLRLGTHGYKDAAPPELSRLGRRLVAEAEEYAWNNGCAWIEVTSADHRSDAHAFYEAIGYVQDCRRFVKTRAD
jgi:GNAT superfamily N-acetyltransferase